MSRPYDTHAEFWAKFWGKVQKTDGCWLWTGIKNQRGYGRIDYRGSGFLAHRVMLFWFNRLPALTKMSQVKEGITLHSCDNPSCVNPSHLRIGTASDNMNDTYRRGRMPSKQGERGPLAKLSDRDALDVLLATTIGVARADLAKKYGVNRSSIDSVVLGKTFKHVFNTFKAAQAAQTAGA
jgi:hypothetical protein